MARISTAEGTLIARRHATNPSSFRQQQIHSLKVGMPEPKPNFPRTAWNANTEAHRVWSLNGHKRVTIAHLREHLKTVSDVLHRPDLDPFQTGSTQASDLSESEAKALALFGISTRVLIFQRNPQKAVQQQRGRIEEWLFDKLWARPSDPEYLDMMGAFCQHIAEDLRRPPRTLRAWPEVSTHSSDASVADHCGTADYSIAARAAELEIAPTTQPGFKKPDGKALPIFHIRKILQLRLQRKFSRNATAKELGIAGGSVTYFTTLALKAGLTWERISTFSDTDLQALMRPGKSKRQLRPQPDFNEVRRRLQQGETLKQAWKQYRDQHANQRPYGYSHFHELFQQWLPVGDSAKAGKQGRSK